MATGTRVRLDEYLRTHYEPECELVDGELRQKAMGTHPHARIQKRLVRLLGPYEDSGLGEVLPEINVRMGEDTVLIPDVAFSRSGAPANPNYLEAPPWLCVEIISPSQTFSEMCDKCRRYLVWGVAHCWIVDPVQRIAWQICKDGAAIEVPANASLRADDIAVSLADLFRAG